MYDSQIIPIAIASPWKNLFFFSRYVVSMACPIVCPKFKIFLNPSSVRSFSTTSLFIKIECLTISSQLLSFQLILVISLNFVASFIRQCFITSAKPDLSSLSDRDEKNFVSTIIRLGILKIPI